MIKYFVFFLLVSVSFAAPPPVQTINITQASGTAAISATNITTVTDTTLYSEMFSLDRTTVHSFDMTIDTTNTISAVIEIEVSSDGTNWFPANTTGDHGVTVTADFSKNVPVSLGVNLLGRFRFTKDTGTPTIPYEVEYLKFHKQ